MAPRIDEPPETFLIGPGIDPTAPKRGDAGRAKSPRAEGRRLLTRLLVAFAILVLVAVGCYVVLPRFGVDLPSWVPLAAFAIIAVGVLANASSEGQFGARDETSDDPGRSCEAGDCGDGRPVGCCPGPRPPRFLGGEDPKR